jgi:hypothetical protein
MKLIFIIPFMLLVSCGMTPPILTPSGCLEKDFLDSQQNKYYAGACFDKSAYVRWAQADSTQVMMRRNPQGKVNFYYRPDEKSKWVLMSSTPEIPDGVEFPEPEPM